MRSWPQRLRSMVRRPAGSLVLVLLLLASGVGGAALAERPAGAEEPRDPEPRLVDVARATAACPEPVADETTATQVVLAAPGAGGSAASAGSAVGDPAGPGAATAASPERPLAPLVRTAAPGSSRAAARAQTGRLLVRGTGGSAPGLAAEQVTRSTNATMRGLASTACAASGTDFWFVGSGAVVGQRGRVYLTNPEPSPAVVDVDLFGPDGPIPAPDARGVTVAPGEQEVRLLDALAPGTARFAVHVRVRQGRISAAVRDLQVEGLTPLGADWVPAASQPSLRVHVPGVPGGEGERLLQVVAPGESDAIVRVRLLADSGAFAPAGLDVIEVPAGSVSQVDLASVTGGEAVTVELVSDAPVTAGVLTRVAPGSGRLGDIAYAAAGIPLLPAAPGVLPEARAGEALTSTLLLTAPGRAATVRLVPLPPAGGTPVEVDVPAESQVPVDLSTVADLASFSVEVRPLPGSGPVLAARLLEELEARGPMLTSGPVLPGRYEVPVPRVQADLSTGLRAGSR